MKETKRNDERKKESMKKGGRERKDEGRRQGERKKTWEMDEGKRGEKKMEREWVLVVEMRSRRRNKE